MVLDPDVSASCSFLACALSEGSHSILQNFLFFDQKGGIKIRNTSFQRQIGWDDLTCVPAPPCREAAL